MGKEGASQGASSVQYRARRRQCKYIGYAAVHFQTGELCCFADSMAGMIHINGVCLPQSFPACFVPDKCAYTDATSMFVLVGSREWVGVSREHMKSSG